MAIDWSREIDSFIEPYSIAFYPCLFGLLAWFAIHYISGYLLENYTNWIDNCAVGMKQSAEAKGKQVKDLATYKKTAKWEMSIKCVAFIHAVISSIGALYAILTSDYWIMTFDHIYEQNELKRVIVCISACFFLYDLAIALVDFDVPFLIHGGMSSLIYVHAVGKSFCLQMGCFFLLYEFSTVFLNIRALMIASQNTKNALFPIIEKLFFGTFIFFRDVIGFTYSLLVLQPLMVKMLFDVPGQPHSYIAVVCFILSNLAINSLCAMWTISMIKIAMGRGKGASKKATEAENKTPVEKKVD